MHVYKLHTILKIERTKQNKNKQIKKTFDFLNIFYTKSDKNMYYELLFLLIGIPKVSKPLTEIIFFSDK